MRLRLAVQRAMATSSKPARQPSGRCPLPSLQEQPESAVCDGFLPAVVALAAVVPPLVALLEG